MSQIFWIIIIISISFSVGESQLLRSYGIKVGMASTTETWNYAPQLGIKTNSSTGQGLDVGVYAEWLDIPTLSILSELHYIQKGENFSATIHSSYSRVSQSISFTSKVNYISIPILAKLRINWGVAVPYVLVGPRFDFYLSGNDPFNTYDFRKIDIGGTVGIGIEPLTLLPIQVGAEIRYSPTFTNSPMFTTMYPEANLTIKNQSFEFLIVMSL